MYDSQALSGFMEFDLSRESVPDATTLMGFRHLLEENDLTRAMFVEVNANRLERGLLMTQGTLFAHTTPPWWRCCMSTRQLCATHSARRSTRRRNTSPRLILKTREPLYSFCVERLFK